MELQDKSRHLSSSGQAAEDQPEAPASFSSGLSHAGRASQSSLPSAVAKGGLLLGLAVLCGYVEAIVPIPLPIPGMKLGLANIVIVTILYLSGWKQALVVSGLRVLIIGALFGNLFSIAYGLAGTACSILGMTLLKRTGAFSALSVSALGGVLHNCGQVLVAVLVVIGFPWQWYLPILMLTGLGAGVVIGFLNRLLLPRLTPLFRN